MKIENFSSEVPGSGKARRSQGPARFDTAIITTW